MCVPMKNVKTKTVKSYLYLNIANLIDAMANVLSVHYKICSDFSQNIQTFQTMLRVCSDNVQNIQNLFRMSKICSEFSINTSRTNWSIQKFLTL
jgi:hypothetical protein